MKMRVFLFLLLLCPVAVFAQKKVLIQSVRIDNNYAEVSVNPFTKPEHEALFLERLEQTLQEHLGPLTISYLNEREKIMLHDKAIASADPRDVIEDYQELYRNKKEVDRQAYDMRLDVTFELVDIFKGKNDNFQVLATVVARDQQNDKLFKHKGKVNVVIPPIPFSLDQLNQTGTTVYEGFPLSESKLVEALGSSIAQAFVQKKEVPQVVVERQAFEGYSDFMNQAESYRIMARNDYGDYLIKYNLFRILTFSKRRPLVVSRQSDQQGILLGLRERRITDIGYQYGIPPAYEVGKLHKNFLLYSQFSPERKDEYFLHTVLTDKKALGVITWSDPIKLKLKSTKKENVGDFTFRVNTNTDAPLQQEARLMNRVYHPWASLEGTLEGKSFDMRTNPYLLNAVEIKWGGQLVGLVVHAAAPRKYLRKRKNALPYYVYFHPDCTDEQQQMLLQTFQTFHVATVLKNGQDVEGNRIQ